MSTTLTFERAHEFLKYNPETGILIWKKRAGNGTFNSRFAGHEAGNPTPKGYRILTIDYVVYRSHNVAWLMQTGELPLRQIDHINGVADDNRFENLRKATMSQNNANRRTYSRQGAKGVRSVPSGRFQANISSAGRTLYIGTFDTIEEANAAYYAKALELHGEFARAF